MSREFDGSDVIVLDEGALDTVVGGAWTIVCLVKATSILDFTCFISLEASGSQRLALWVDASANFFAAIGGSNYTFTGLIISTNVWYLAVVKKAAGDNAPRAALFNYTTDTWSSWVNSAGTADNDGNTITAVRLGDWVNNNPLIGREAAAAVWSSALADATVTNAVTGLAPSAANWFTLTPLAMWRLNQASIATPVEDDMPGNADQTAITGTTVSADEPDPWSYSLSGATDLVVADATQAQAVDNVALGVDLVVADVSQAQTVESPTIGPGFVINALLNPSWYGWPDGPTTGTSGVLTPVAGGIDVTVNDTVIEDLFIDDSDGTAGYGIFVAAGVTGTIIRNVHIITIPGPGGGGIVISDAVGGEVLIQDSELEYAAPGTYASVISGPNWTGERLHLHHISEGPRMQDDTTLVDSFIELMEVDDPDAHADGVQSTGGSNIVIHHNTISVDSIGADFANAAIIFGSEFDENINGEITDNLLDWGGFTLQFGQSNFPMENLTISGNRFGRNASFGPYATDGVIINLTWGSPDPNVFDDDNTVIDGPPVVVPANDAAQAQVVDNVTLTQLHILVVADAVQAQLADNVAVSTEDDLGVNECLQAQTVDNVTLAQTHILTVQDATQAQVVESPTMTITLNVADALQAQVVDNVNLPGFTIPDLVGTVTTSGLSGSIFVKGLAGTVEVS